MASLTAYLNYNANGDTESWLEQALRSDTVAFMIGHRGQSVTLVRGTNTLTAQSMLVAPIASGTYSQRLGQDSGEAAKQQLMLVCMPTANIARADRFSYSATPSGRLNYTVDRVERLYNGMLQAIATEVQ